MVDPVPDRPNDHGMKHTLIIFGVFHSVLKREHAVKTCPAKQFPGLHRYVLVFQCMCQFIMIRLNKVPICIGE